MASKCVASLANGTVQSVSCSIHLALIGPFPWALNGSLWALNGPPGLRIGIPFGPSMSLPGYSMGFSGLSMALPFGSHWALSLGPQWAPLWALIGLSPWAFNRPFPWALIGHSLRLSKGLPLGPQCASPWALNRASLGLSMCQIFPKSRFGISSPP